MLESLPSLRDLSYAKMLLDDDSLGVLVRLLARLEALYIRETKGISWDLLPVEGQMAGAAATRAATFAALAGAPAPRLRILSLDFADDAEAQLPGAPSLEALYLFGHGGMRRLLATTSCLPRLRILGMDVSALAPSLPALAAATSLERLVLDVRQPCRPPLRRVQAVISTLQAMPSLCSVEFVVGPTKLAAPVQALLQRAPRACPHVRFRSLTSDHFRAVTLGQLARVPSPPHPRAGMCSL